MRINEITDAQGQLELLRTVIDNTWTAIAQQAEQEKRAEAERKAQAKLKRDVSDAEADLAKLEVVLSAIDRAMFAPASAANEYKNLTMGELSQRRGKIIAAQEAAEARWVAAGEALEKVS